MGFGPDDFEIPILTLRVKPIDGKSEVNFEILSDAPNVHDCPTPALSDGKKKSGVHPDPAQKLARFRYELS